jgi:[acyl-carrier-protein] S-malonyltransferase
MQKTAFVFPGQGSQKVGMLNEIAEKFPAIVAQTFAVATEVLGYDLWQIVVQGPVELLNQTQYTQAAMLTADIAIWKIWCEQGGELPALIAGHSLGEYAALVAAEAMLFADAITLVSKRAQLMQEAVTAGTGAMVVILGLTAQQAIEVCQEAAQQEIVQAVNFNAPGQVVIAGNSAAVDRAMLLAKEAGAKRVRKLPVSVASHCLLMKPAAEKLAAYLTNVTLQSPKIPVVNNVDVQINTDPTTIKDALVRQLYCPVRWIETIEFMSKAQNITTVIECGPGKVLTGLNKRINSELTLYSLHNVAGFEEALVGRE